MPATQTATFRALADFTQLKSEAAAANKELKALQKTTRDGLHGKLSQDIQSTGKFATYAAAANKAAKAITALRVETSHGLNKKLQDDLGRLKTGTVARDLNAIARAVAAIRNSSRAGVGDPFKSLGASATRARAIIGTVSRAITAARQNARLAFPNPFASLARNVTAAIRDIGRVNTAVSGAGGAGAFGPLATSANLAQTAIHGITLNVIALGQAIRGLPPIPPMGGRGGPAAPPIPPGTARGTNAVGDAAGRAGRQLRGLRGSLDAAGDAARRLGGTFSTIAGTFSTFAGQALVGGSAVEALGVALGLLIGAAASAGVQFNAFKEQVIISLETILGSTSAATEGFETMVQAAAKTPFEQEQLINLTQRLVAGGLEFDQIIRSQGKSFDGLAISIGDAVSAFGGDQAKLNIVARAFQQIGAKGKVQAEELLQVAETGIPIFKILQKELNLTGQEVANIGRQNVTAQQFFEAFEKGVVDFNFAGLMEKQAKTMNGIITNIRDTVKIILGGAFEFLFNLIKKGAQDVLSFLEDFQILSSRIGFGEAVKEMIPEVAEIIEIFVEFGKAIRNLAKTLKPLLVGVSELIGVFAGSPLLGTIQLVTIAINALVTVLNSVPPVLLSAIVAFISLTKALVTLRAALTALTIIRTVTGLFGLVAAGQAALNAVNAMASVFGASAITMTRMQLAMAGLRIQMMALLTPANLFLVAAAAIGTAIFLTSRASEEARKNYVTYAEAAKGAASKLGLLTTAAQESAKAAKEAAGDTVDETSEGFKEVEAQLKKTMDSLATESQKQRALILFGFKLVSEEGATPKDALKQVKELANRAGVTLPIDLDLSSFDDLETQLSQEAINIAEALDLSGLDLGADSFDTRSVEDIQERIQALSSTVGAFVQGGQFQNAISLMNSFSEALKVQVDIGAITPEAGTAATEALNDEIIRFLDLSGAATDRTDEITSAIAEFAKQTSNPKFKEYAENLLTLVDNGRTFGEAIVFLREEFPDLAGETALLGTELQKEGEDFDNAALAADNFGAALEAVSERGQSAIESFTGTSNAISKAKDTQKDLDKQRKKSTDVADSYEDKELDIERSAIGNIRAQQKLEEAQKELDAVRRKTFADELAKLERDAARASLDHEKAVFELYQAELKLAQLRRDRVGFSEIREAELEVADARLQVNDSSADLVENETELADIRSGAAQLKAIADAELEVREAILGVAEAARDLGKAYEESKKPQEEFTEDATEQALGLNEFLTSLGENQEAQDAWINNIIAIGIKARKLGIPIDGVIGLLEDMGEEGQLITGQLANATDEDFKRAATVMGEEAKRGTDAYIETIGIQLDAAKVIAGDKTAEMTDIIKAKLDLLPPHAQDTIDAIKMILGGIARPIGDIANIGTGVGIVIPGGGLLKRGSFIQHESYSKGGFKPLPEHAVFKGPGPSIVNWREPGTLGESFIPHKRSPRALNIWKKTGEVIGGFESLGDVSFSMGGITAPTVPPVSSVSAPSHGDDNMQAFEQAITNALEATSRRARPVTVHAKEEANARQIAKEVAWEVSL